MLPAARRVVPTLVRSAATVMLGTLLAVLPDVALSLLRPAAVPVAHAQFGGCPVSGTWIGGPSGFDYRWSLKEDGGVVSGSTIPVGDTDPTHALIASTGSRSGASVSIAFTTGGTGVPLLGTMSDCDHIDAQVNGQTFTIARVDVAYCGDGLPDAGEACDDDNFTNGDTCTVLCANQSCGNRVVEPGEACDDGNLVQVDGCSNACQSNACGNGVVESGEQCDDGNQVNGDGCSRTCAPNVCGNGVVESGERCDDGLPPANGDGCSTLCQFEGCDMSGTWQVASGGIGTFFLREDASHQIDGNSFSFGFDPTSAQRVTSGNRNGNAVLLVQGTIGAVGEMTSCSTVALSVPSLGISLTLTRLSTSFCGDGVEDAGEECDDGNFANGDACTASCTEPRCGNRISEPGETCDDGNLVPADGCSNDCQVNHCGDGSNPPEPGEECDDGNLTDGDGCSKQCRVNLCGNGIIEPGEQCDDGDLPPAGGDGCSTLCQFEGCPVTGVWVVDGGATNEVERLVEGPGGAITGFHGEPTAAAPSFTITGTRIGGTVSALLLSGGSPTAVATLSQTDCDHVAGTATLPGAGGATVPLSMTRISSGDCGDGAKSGGEQCDDGNTAGNDDCNFACQLPHCGDGPPLDPYETCDDGNGNPNDACKNDCTPNVCGDGVQNVGVEQCDDGNASDEDACKTDCTLNVCGDGKLLAGVEACDDGDTEPSDGCDETCNVEEIQVAALPASGGTVSTDPENDGATPDDPMETAITVPANGTSVVVSIAETSATVPTSGYFALGKQVNITVPPTTAQTPMSFVFSLDASVVPPGQDATTIVVFRNGTPVPNCLGASQAVPFDPCVTAREQLGDGDVRITVLTSRASAWSLAARRPLPGAQEAACRKEIRKQVSTLFQKRLGVLARCEDLVRKGKATAPCPDGDALARIAAAEAKVDPTKLEKKCAATLIGTLGLTGSCSAATSPATLAACLVAAAASATDELADAEYATPAATITDKALLSCQATIAKESGKKFAPKRLKIFDACNGKLDADKVAACLDPTSSAQLGDAEGKLAAGIGGHCTDVQVTALGTFGGPCATASDVASLVGCQLATHRARTDQILSLLP